MKVLNTLFMGLVMLILAVSVTQAKSDNAALRGKAFDPNNTWLGEVTYLFNKPGYHFWFTPTANGGPYTAGHSYHNVYKYEVENPGEWCGPTTIPDRLPYNAGATAGETAYYKIWDITDNKVVCPL